MRRRSSGECGRCGGVARKAARETVALQGSARGGGAEREAGEEDEGRWGIREDGGVGDDGDRGLVVVTILEHWIDRHVFLAFWGWPTGWAIRPSGLWGWAGGVGY
jgi:hypothetical protein